MDEVQTQLKAVEEALHNAKNEDERMQLQSLKENLIELIELTSQPETSVSGNDHLDSEIALFMSEIQGVEASNSNETSNNEDNLEALKNKYQPMVGEKCSAPHEHCWGSVSYHNAIICSIEDEAVLLPDGKYDVRLRVLFTNPTHREMVPCKYYLDGDCRFEADRCNFSHGEVVSAESIKAYKPPEFERLARNCAVLSKLNDRIWYRGRVLCVNFVEQNCRIKLDGREHKQREIELNFENIYPILNDDGENEISSDDSADSFESDEQIDDVIAAQQAQLIQKSLFTFKPTQMLGEWEKHTRGIGSKLMEKMGYIHGTGLGSDARGIVTPVSAQILPQGRSLDACMELREAANGNSDFFSVEKKLIRDKKRQEVANKKAYEREIVRTDLFSFLNQTVLSNKSGPSCSKVKTKVKADFKQWCNKSLNVNSVRIADDIRRKEREILKMKGTINRNVQGIEIQNQLKCKLGDMQQELRALQCQESALSKEQDARRAKSKMHAF